MTQDTEPKTPQDVAQDTTPQKSEISQPKTPQDTTPQKSEVSHQEEELSEEEQLQNQIKQLTESLEKAQANLLRERAELENFKRRSAKASSETLKYASFELVKELLPVLDSLEKAIESAKNEESSVDSIREGLEMVYKIAQDALAKHGTTLIDPVGEEFDPNQHQAVGMVASEEVPEDHVVDVMQKGYMLYERVIRAAMVRVAQK